MENFTIIEGLILTIVSMLTVFIVLASIWGLVELTTKLIARFETDETKPETPVKHVANEPAAPLVAHPKHQKVAEIMALILASEDQPNKKFEIVISKRVK